MSELSALRAIYEFIYLNLFVCLYLFSVYSVVENTVYVTTPAVNVTATHMVIKVELKDGSLIRTNYTFEYRSNPAIIDIRPRNHLTVYVFSNTATSFIVSL